MTMTMCCPKYYQRHLPVSVVHYKQVNVEHLKSQMIDAMHT